MTARRVVLVELLAMMFSFVWGRLVSVGEERADGAGRDRPKSRSPAGWPTGARRGPP
ncbi:hypothetical protein [Microbispora sp. H11081]|uniref:hypothetical protein n=1 Tax=Microbispora sp. H11081 TaxID=2729107 RepID=UPI001475962E|nr:hypothetical protein [Microbispora sp. H11081]